MPFYEYQCAHCGHELEAMQKVSDVPLKKCPECGKARLERLMSAPVFRLKGGGWYETDFKNDKDNKRNLAERAEPEAPKDSKVAASEPKSEAAPANTSEVLKDAKTKSTEKAADSHGSEKKAVTKKRVQNRRTSSRRQKKAPRRS